MPIGASQGTLDVENAKFRASELMATTSVGIGTVSDANYPVVVFKENDPEIRIQEGTVATAAARIYSNNSNLVIQSGTNFTPGSPGNIHFATMGGDTTHLTIQENGNVFVNSNLSTQRLTLNNVSISTTTNLQQATDTGNVTSNIVQFTNPTTAFVTTANVGVGGELTVTGNVGVSHDLTVTGNVGVSSNLEVTGNVGVSQDLTVTGNIYGPMTTFRAYSFKTSYSTSWTSAEGLAGTEKTILTQNVTVPDTYTSVSPCTMRVFYMWKWVGEWDSRDDGTTSERPQEPGWRTSVTHNATTYDMNTGNFGATSSGFYVVSSTALGYDFDEASTMDLAVVEGNFEINGVSAGDTLAIDLNVVATNDDWGTIYTNRTVTDIDNDSRERGTTSLVVWLEPIL
jgi:hypothetical protein